MQTSEMPENRLTPDQREALQRNIEEELSHRFRRAKDDPVMQQLKEILLEYSIRRIE